ncbi:hypothetical protein [Senegalia massiliensis]|uniref:Uncharacterized protein n=1 Tax=Senegalia massiliensis TaxID=1720316 RepID=A0A845R3Z0_9CLOT|nr:hypothetical protein [Senegalia massiliensis]NBI08328.1 hypothetical protein [Senegalia massiliensis]
MEMLCSLKSYYQENKLSRILVNVFFFIIILIYLFPFWGFKVFGFNTEEVIFDYLFKIFQFDFVVTGALTVIFIMMYSYLMSNSIIIKAIYTIIFVLNLWYSIMGIGMFSNPFSYKDFLALLPQIILLIIFGLIFHFIA